MKRSVFLVIILIGSASCKTIRYTKTYSQTRYTPEVAEAYQGYDDLRSTVSSFASTSLSPKQAVVEVSPTVLVSEPTIISPVSTVYVAPAVIDDNGYSSGSGLRSIAQGSADKANSIIAKQHAAGVQAAYYAQATLAQSAAQAAATANAAFAGKEVLWQNLEKQGLEAVRQLDEEISQLETARKAAAKAKLSAVQAASHVATLTAALNSAQQLAERAERTVEETEAELSSQTVMVGEAQGRLNSIAAKLAAAQVDFEATKEAAAKATGAAEEAQRNVEAANIYASVKLIEVASSTLASVGLQDASVH